MSNLLTHGKAYLGGGEQEVKCRTKAPFKTRANKPALTQILEQAEQERVTEEQLRRILGPVFKRINEGRFDGTDRPGQKKWVE